MTRPGPRPAVGQRSELAVATLHGRKSALRGNIQPGRAPALVQHLIDGHRLRDAPNGVEAELATVEVARDQPVRRRTDHHRVGGGQGLQARGDVRRNADGRRVAPHPRRDIGGRPRPVRCRCRSERGGSMPRSAEARQLSASTASRPESRIAPPAGDRPRGPRGIRSRPSCRRRSSRGCGPQSGGRRLRRRDGSRPVSRVAPRDPAARESATEFTRSQNRHVNCRRSASEVVAGVNAQPHSKQNFARSGFSAWQAVQRITRADRLGK